MNENVSPTRRGRRWIGVVVATLLASAAVVGYGSASIDATSAERPAACTPAKPGPPPEQTPTTVTTLGQAYYCVFANYYSGPVLDSRSLLVPAFAALTQELQRRGLDQAQATLPVLTGKKDADWTAFSRVYQRITAALPDAAARQAVAAATMNGMIDSLGDNHAQWLRGSVANRPGLDVSAVNGPGNIDLAATDPLFAVSVVPGGPAAEAGVLVGDEIVAVDGVPPYVNGMLSEGVLKSVTSGASVVLTLHRPATAATVTTTVTARPYPMPRPAVTATLVDGDIAKITLPAFSDELADEVLTAIAELRARSELRGVVLDLRGNGGGSPDALRTLLGALVHNKVYNHWCDVNGRCTPNRTDASVKLLGLPFIALTDRRCVSACDAFAAAVKELRLGTLVGTRTAGAVSGPAYPFVLDDGSSVAMPKFHQVGAHKGIVDTIGVAPDHVVPMTAADLSAGRDPVLAKAVSLL